MDHLSQQQALVHSTSDAGWTAVLVLVLPLASYLLFAWRQVREGRGWSWWRTASFTAGIGLLGIALSPPIAAQAHDDLRAHMVQHLLIGMVAPLGVVLSAPMTLVLRTVPVTWGRTISSLLRSQPVHVVSHPLTTLVLNVGGMYVLYATPLFAATLTSPALHALVQFHFFAAGYLFAWAIAGPDPAPRRPGVGFRLAVLVVAIAAHASLGKMMYAHLWPRGTSFEPSEIQDAAVLMYYGGDIAEMLLAVALLVPWYARRRRRFDAGLPVTATQ